MNKSKMRKDIKLLNESIAHWDRMIRWARKQPQDEEVCDEPMLRETNERWYSRDCALCREYKAPCEGCPLEEAGNCCYSWDSTWRKVSDAATWGEWVEKAKEMLAVLKKIRGGEYAEELGAT